MGEEIMVKKRKNELQTRKGADGKRRVEMFCWEVRHTPTVKVPLELYDEDGKFVEGAGKALWSMWRERYLWAIHDHDGLKVGDTVLVPRVDETLSGEVITSIEGNFAYADVRGWRHFFEYVESYVGPPGEGKKKIHFWAYKFSGNVAAIKKLELFSADSKGGSSGEEDTKKGS